VLIKNSGNYRVFFVIVIEMSVFIKFRLNEQVKDYLMPLNGYKSDIKQHCGPMIVSLVDFLENNGINRFEDSAKTEIDQFLSNRRFNKR
jgi:hypothetical protein